MDKQLHTHTHTHTHTTVQNSHNKSHNYKFTGEIVGYITVLWVVCPCGIVVPVQDWSAIQIA